MNWGVLLPLTVAYALAFCVVFTAILITGALIAVDALAHDYPPEIQRRYGLKSARGRRTAVVMSVAMAAVFIATPVAAMWHLATWAGQPPGFWDGFVFGLGLMVILNLYDLFILDWWLFCTVRPKFLVLPGTEDMPQYRDKAYHWKVLVPRPIPWPLLMIPGFGVVTGAATALVSLWLLLRLRWGPVGTVAARHPVFRHRAHQPIAHSATDFAA